MSVFRLQGGSARGAAAQGSMEAPNRSAAPLRSSTESSAQTRGTGTAAHRERPLQIFLSRFRDKIQDRDLLIFTRQFTSMLRAGLPITDALGVLSTQSSNWRLRGALAQIKTDVEAGATLTGAMRNHPHVFQETYLNTVAAGETGGVLHHVLPRLAHAIEKSGKLKGKIRSALTYPVTVLVVAAVVTTVLLVFVIPTFAGMFASIDKALPWPTQFVINLSELTIAWMPYGVVLALAAAAMGRHYYRTDSGRLVIDQLLLRTPLFGDLVLKATVARVMHTLSTLVASGTPLLDALDIAARTSGNRVIQRALLASRDSVSEGRMLTDPLVRSQVFPPLVCQMVSIGESTGSLDTMLHELAGLYEEEVDHVVAYLTTLMEPLLMVVLGVVIGGLLVAMYLPIFQLGAVLG